jgi:iron complex outermembrane receptor protein
MLKRTQLSLLIMAIAGNVAPSAFAQSTATPAETVVELGQVVVTGQSGATKLDTPTVETPQAVSVVERAQFEERGATSVRNAVGYTPGVFSNQIGASNRYDYMVLRGFSDGSLDNVYLDGLKVTGDTNSYSSLVIDPWFLSSIEVVRGPASVLYGRSSPGGIVALQSRQPESEFGGEVKLTLGNNNRRGLAFDVTGPVGDGSRVTYRLGGLVSAADTQFGPIKEKRYALSPSITWKITDATTLRLMAYLQNDPEGGSHSGLPYDGTVIAHNGRKIANTFYEGESAYEKFERDQKMVGYELEHRFNDTFTARQRLRYLNSDVTLNQVYAYGWASPTTLNRYYSGGHEKLDAITVDNQLEATFKTGALGHRVLVGLDYQQFDNDVLWTSGQFPAIDAFNPQYGSGMTTAYPDSRQKHSLKQTGVYLQDQLSLDRWRLTLGGRYDQVDIVNTDLLSNARSTLDKRQFSGRAGLLYLFDQGFAPYMSYSTAFTPTSFVDAKGDLLAPMTGKQLEAGLKYEPKGTNDRYNISVFQINQKNVATKEQPTDPYRAVGEIESKGVELEAATTLGKNVTLQAAYSYTDIRYKKSDDGNEGNRAVYSPLHQASVWANYHFREGALSGLRVGAGIRYFRDIKADRANTYTLPAYSLVDMSIAYNLRALGLPGVNAQLNINNLTNKNYVAACNSLDFCYFGAERSVTASLSYAF